jgi:hypothetical protein
MGRRERTLRRRISIHLALRIVVHLEEVINHGRAGSGEAARAKRTRVKVAQAALETVAEGGPLTGVLEFLCRTMEKRTLCLGAKRCGTRSDLTQHREDADDRA